MIEFGYDANGNLTSHDDQNGNTTTCLRRAFGAPLQVCTLDGQLEEENLRFIVAALLVAACPVASHAYVYCDDLEQGYALGKAQHGWRKAMVERRFKELDAHFSSVLAAHDAGRVSDAEVAYEFGMFSSVRPADEPLHESWIKAHPKSRAARLARAYYFVARGWAARGTELAGKTSDIQFTAMAHAFDRAMADLDAAESLAKKPTPEWAERINILMTAGGRGDELSTAIYRKAIKKYPDTFAVRTSYANASTPQWGGSFERLARIREEASSLPPDDRRYVQSRVDISIGDAYAFRKEDAKAAQSYERAMSACKGFSDAAYKAMQIHAGTKNFPGLVSAAGHAIVRDPDSGWALSMRGWAYLSMNKLHDAFRDYEKAAKLGFPGAFEHLAWFYEGGRGGAPQDFRKAIDLYMIAHDKGVAGAKAKAEKVRAGTGLK